MAMLKLWQTDVIGTGRHYCAPKFGENEGEVSMLVMTAMANRKGKGKYDKVKERFYRDTFNQGVICLTSCHISLNQSSPLQTVEQPQAPTWAHITESLCCGSYELVTWHPQLLAFTTYSIP